MLYTFASENVIMYGVMYGRRLKRTFPVFDMESNLRWDWLGLAFEPRAKPMQTEVLHWFVETNTNFVYNQPVITEL